MQILHPFEGSVQAYAQQLGEADRYRPAGCPLCGAKKPLIAHGFYGRSVVAEGFDGWIRVRRYLCRLCQRTVSLLPEFVLPYVRFAISLIGRYLEAHLLKSQTLRQAAQQAGQEQMPYQRGQGWVSRFRRQARLLSASLVALTRAVAAPGLAGGVDGFPGRCGCSKARAGSAPIVFCFLNCGCTCWAGPVLWLRTGDLARLGPPSRCGSPTHTTLAWRDRAGPA